MSLPEDRPDPQPRNIALRGYREAKVTGDWTDKEYPALVLSTTWNGWAGPLFEKATAERIVKDQAELIAQYGPDAGNGLHWEGDAIRVTYDEDPVVEYIFPDDAGFYAVGASEWCWEVVA